MSKPRIVVAFGTRPEAIKMAPVVRALRDLGSLRVDAVDTGQHRELVQQVLTLFRLRAQHSLNVMKRNQSVSEVISKTLNRTTRLFEQSRPDMVLVQGDTASAFAVALGAFLVGARVGHVEAGLRSGDLKAPFPEELMRLMVDRATDTYFAPTTFARDNLLREGVNEGRVFVTGNTVTDALRFICELRTMKIRAPEWRTSGPHVLITMHRRESFGAPMLESLRAIQQLVEHYPDLSVIFPVHPNPNVRSAVRDALASHPRICLCEPLDYLALVRLLSEAQLVLSDSGGIQEEAPSFNVPVLILRDVTERPEGITFARNRLVGTSRSRILRAAAEVLAESAPAPGRALAPSPSVFGDGVTASRIARIVEATLYDHSIDRGEVEYHFTAPRHTGRRRAV